MSKKEYLDKLRKCLSRLSRSEVDDIISDYEEHFLFGTESGKSEEQVADKLGSPQVLAKAFIAQARIDEFYAPNSSTITKKTKSYLKAVLAFLILAPLNFLIFTGPFIVILSVLVSAWAALGGIFIGAFTYYGKYLFAENADVMGMFTNLSVLFLWLGILGLCVLLAMVFYYLSKVSIKGTLSYIKWNIKIITNKANGELV
jgi:uncharacterized membrane protein